MARPTVCVDHLAHILVSWEIPLLVHLCILLLIGMSLDLCQNSPHGGNEKIQSNVVYIREGLTHHTEEEIAGL